MITVIGNGEPLIVKATKFPDGTSQVWKLPEDILEASRVLIDWRFENEAELMTLASLKALLSRPNGPWPSVYLDMPYLPYARQDKACNNQSTFNLRVFARMLNLLEFDRVTVVDPHSDVADAVLERLRIRDAQPYQEKAIEDFKPDTLVFPDAGAAERYAGTPALEKFSYLSFKKRRDQATGEILGHEVDKQVGAVMSPKRFLIVDDICDGGATFISVAKAIQAACANEAVDFRLTIGLYVTHGIFSKGRWPLIAAGITHIYTTDSFFNRNTTENTGSYLKVFEV